MSADQVADLRERLARIEERQVNLIAFASAPAPASNQKVAWVLPSSFMVLVTGSSDLGFAPKEATALATFMLVVPQ